VAVTADSGLASDALDWGKAAVVTGGAGAIGTAICDVLLDAGCSVAVWDRDEALAARPPREQLVPVPCDVTDPAQIDGALRRTHHELGDIGILVNAVGVGQIREPFSEMDPARWSHIVEVNLVGAVRCIHAVLPDMVRARGGVVVNICSIWSTRTGRGRSAYIASKWGLLGATKALASELVDSGVRVCAVSPGPVNTPMTAGIAPDDVRRQWMAPGDVAATVRFVLGSAGRHVVGGEVQIFGRIAPYDGPAPSDPSPSG
jgi:NAD(P)-dependent dehydrogenase (short-subunit alcohol dehydrogenase family)